MMKYLFVNGRLAVQIRFWEEPGLNEGGCRVELRRVSQVEGENHRPGAAGCEVSPVDRGGLWRADLFVDFESPGRGCFHYHPSFGDADVGLREFEPSIEEEPREWIEDKLTDLPGLLESCGGLDLLPSVDLHEYHRSLTVMLSAVDLCLGLIPAELVRRSKIAGAAS